MVVSKQQNTAWSRLHFFIRLLGLTGLAVAGLALALALIDRFVRPTWSERLTFGENLQQNWANLQENWTLLVNVIQAQGADSYAEVVVFMLAIGLLVAVVALVVEVLAVSRKAAGQRSAFGLNAVLQVVLATILVLIVNAYAFQNYHRFDWTRNRQFTLPEELQKNLRELQGDTTIIVYLPHQSFGERAQDLDPEERAYVYAAERKVVEKLKDMVEQFRELGKQFRVAVLDVEDWQNFKTRRDEETKDLPELREAIRKAPENTVFFAGQGRVQRLSFSDLFLLDKENSFKANDGKGNLVLLNQGIGPLARKVLAINEKKPTIGVAVIHEWLTTEGRKDLPFTMMGLKKALTARGFEVKDIVLKKWSRSGPPEPAVYTADDGKLDRLDERLTTYDNNVKVLTQVLAEREKMLKQWTDAPLEELTKKFADDFGVKRVSAEMRKDIVEQLTDQVDSIRESLEHNRKRRKEVVDERGKLSVDSLAEARRMSDLQAKLTRTLADCDLLIVPRLTVRNVVETEENIPNWLHRLDKDQTDVLRDFVKDGKPILVCFGSTSEAGDRQPPPGGNAGPDGLEDMLSKLGVKFVNQTVLFDTESEAFTSRGGGVFGSEATVEVPPVEFNWKPGAGRVVRTGAVVERKPHPIRESMRLTARSLGRDSQGKSLLPDLRLRHPQPVYYEPPQGVQLDFDPEIMLTSAASWNEDKPFPADKYVPEPPKTLPKRSTVEEKRRGPFPIGVAVTTPVPAEWYTEKNAKPATVRLAVIGHGSVFNGAELSPAREILLLDTCNWLLGRDQELSRKEDVWSYPRVQMDETDYERWKWGARLGLMMLFAYLGCVVVLARRVR